MMEERSSLTVSGVSDVERFDENEIVMSTSKGTLVVTGREPAHRKLSLDGGDLEGGGGHWDALPDEESRRGAQRRPGWPGCCADHAGAVGFPGALFLEALAAGALLGMLLRPVPGPAGAVAAAMAAACLDFGFWITVCGTLFLFAILRGRRAGAPVPRGCLCRRGRGYIL